MALTSTVVQATMGIKMYTATEATAGTLPTTGWTEIANIVDLPEYTAARAGLDYTPISELVAHRYIPGLIDGGDSWSLTVNMSEDFVTAWNALEGTATTAFADGKATWFAIIVPGWDNAFYVAGIPNQILWPGAGVDEVFQGNASITVTDASKGWAAKPTV